MAFYFINNSLGLSHEAGADAVRHLLQLFFARIIQGKVNGINGVSSPTA